MSKPFKPIRMTVHIPIPKALLSTDWDEAISRCDTKIRYDALCDIAGIRPRISGKDLERWVYLTREGHSARKLGDPECLMVLAKEGDPHHRALRALEILAYGFLDYAAREAVCGRGYFKPGRPPGRPKTGVAQSSAQRVRRLRERSAAPS